MLRHSSAEVLAAAAADRAVMGRFWSHVARGDGGACWIWTGAISGRGHGRFWIGTGRVVVAHRLAWVASHPGEPVPSVVSHDCDSPGCVNPAHLRASDPASNRAEYLARAGLPGSPLNDTRGARGRAVALRDAARDGADLDAVRAAGASEIDRGQAGLW